MAVDHDMFSFTDTTLGHWPLVLVTNPKDSRFSVPGKEPLGRMAGSTHVRYIIDRVVQLLMYVGALISMTIPTLQYITYIHFPHPVYQDFVDWDYTTQTALETCRVVILESV